MMKGVGGFRTRTSDTKEPGTKGNEENQIQANPLEHTKHHLVANFNFNRQAIKHRIWKSETSGRSDN
jgi:hypothetical protein